jgi:type I restriction enzyme S subunit
MARLDEIFDLQMGKTPSRNNADYWTDGQYDWVSIADLGSYQKYVEDTKERISALAVQESGIKSVPANTVIMSFKLSLGKTAITQEPVYTNEAIMAFIPTEKYAVLPDYFYYLFSAKDWTKGTNRAVMGTTLNKATLSAVSITVPPIDEQRKIAAILDKVSDLIAKRRQQLDKLDEMVKARFVEMFGDPVENPMGWEKLALGKRCDIVTGNTPSRAEPENYGNFIEWIKSDNINTPAVLLTEAQEYLSETGFHKCRFVEAGSLLMTCIAGSINCISNVAVADRRVAFNQQINAIVPKQDDVLYLYWLMLLSKPAIHSTINMSLKGILSKGQLSEMTFPFPPLELQNQFAVFVKKTEKTKANISRSLEKLETLKKALMQEYFG